MIALLKVKLEPTGDFYRKVADRIAQLAHDGKLVKYVDLEEERPHTSQDSRTH